MTEKYLLDPYANRVLSELEEPINRDNFISKCETRNLDSVTAGHIWDLLQSAGLLKEVSSTEQTTSFHVIYSGWRSQRGMIADMYRTRSFEKAIRELVEEGTTVADVGSGSGILTFFAVRAGARRVYALEATDMIRDSQLVARANGLEDRIEYVQGDAAGFVAPEPLDIIVSEWAGVFLIEEWRHFDAFARMRDANLRDGGTVIPSRAGIYLSPVDDSRLYMERGPGFWQRPVMGFDFSRVHKEQMDPTRRIMVHADHRTLLHPVRLLDLDCLTDDSSTFFFEKEFETTFTHASTCHGFVGYFDLELAPGVVLDTSPFSPHTHWHQSYFPFDLIHIEPGDTLCFSVASRPDPFSGSPILEISAELRRDGSRVTEQSHVYTLEDTQG